MSTWDEDALLHGLSSMPVEAVLDPAAWAARQVAEQAREAREAREEQSHAKAILVEDEDAVRKFLDGQLCVSGVL